jgi:hypothetical protein
VVGLDPVLRTMHVPLQLRVAQVGDWVALADWGDSLRAPGAALLRRAWFPFWAGSA